MSIPDDVVVDYTNKTISVSNNIYTVNALYSYLMDVFDELAQMDDDVPMSAQTPTVYTLINGWRLSDNSTNFLSGGSVVSEDGDDLWANVYTIGSIEDGTQLYVVQEGNKLISWWSAGHIDILVQVKSGGTLIDSGKITVFAREYGDVFDHYEIDLSGGGRNPVPLQTSADINNTTASATVAAYGLTFTFGTISRDLNNGNGAQNYDVEIDCKGKTLAEAYEYMKYVTQGGSTTQLNGSNGEQYISACAYSPVKASPFGTFAGGKFFGARGVWPTNYDAADAQNLQLIDASGAVQSPPNVVGVSVSSVVAGDQVAVFVLTAPAGEIDKAKYHVNGPHGTTATTLAVKESISSDTPAAGVIRVNGNRHAYTAWAGSTFTLSGTLEQTYADNDPAYVPLIDATATGTSVNNTLTYAASIPVLVRVRKKGILPFEVETAVGATGMSVAAIRTTDGVVA